MELSEPNKVKITVAEVAAKFRTKSEIYQFTSLDCRAYMPPADCVTIYYLKDLISGDRRCKLLVRLHPYPLLFRSHQE